MSRRSINWLLAAAIAAVLCLGTLSGPDDISVMQAVAANKQAVQTDKLILAGQP